MILNNVVFMNTAFALNYSISCYIMKQVLCNMHIWFEDYFNDRAIVIVLQDDGYDD